MRFLLDSPVLPALAVSALVAAAFAIAILMSKQEWLANIAAPAIFGVAYYETYQKVPTFPPVGAANKVFYVGLLTALAAIAIQRLPGDPLPAWLKATLAAASGVVWIGFNQLRQPDLALIAVSTAMILGGAAALLRVLATAGERDPSSSAAALAMLAAVSILLAPIALFAGSSTSVGLCLGVASGLGILSLAYLGIQRPVPAAALLGVGGGLLAIVDVIAIVSHAADLVALAVAAVSPTFGALMARRMPTSARRPWLVWFVTGAATLSPVVVIFALLSWRHESPL